MHNDIQEILYTESDIADKVACLGKRITDDYRDKVNDGQRLVAVCLLKGAALFMADLVRRIELPMEIDFMVVSSYGDSAKSSGMIRIEKDLATDIKGAHVLIIEDVIDSGLTLSYLCKNLLSREPASLQIASLLWKEIDRQVEIDCEYVGFRCPDEFVVGYGLDFAQRYRNLPYIGYLKREVYEDQ